MIEDLRTAAYIVALALGAVFLAAHWLELALLCVFICLALLVHACLIDSKAQ